MTEVTLRLSGEEITELLVAASEVEDGTKDHALIRDGAGAEFAIYRDESVAEPLPRGTDWWLGPVILIGVLLMLVGAFTITRGLVNLLF